MRLLVDISRVQFTVSKAAEEKRDLDGRHKADRKTGELLYTVQLVALDDSGAEVITVTVGGAPPKVTPGQTVHLVELEAIPWATDKRSGVAYRAKAINPAMPKAA